MGIIDSINSPKDVKKLNNAECTISINEKGSIYFWKVVLNNYINYAGIYVLKADINSVFYNRRESFRVDVYKPAILKLKAKGEPEVEIKGIVKDLSAIGFGFISEIQIEEKLFNGTLFVLEYSDGDFSFSSNFQFKRIFEEDEQFFYGAKFINLKNHKLDKYLSEEQRKLLKKIKEKNLRNKEFI